MRLGTMLGDILGSVFKRPATQHYPFQRTAAPVTLHGKLTWNPQADGQCNGCSLCVKDCPSDAIEIITVDKAAKKFVLRYSADRCTFCAQCVKNCRFNCLGMSATDWELAVLDKDTLVVHYGDKVDVDAVLAKLGKQGPDAKLTLAAD